MKKFNLGAKHGLIWTKFEQKLLQLKCTKGYLLQKKVQRNKFDGVRGVFG